MCLLCGAGSVRLAEFAIVTRPVTELRGRSWAGPREAVAGAARALLEDVRAAAPPTRGLWAGPIVSIAWNGPPEGPRLFAGVALEGEEEAGPGLPERLVLPPRRFAAAWHESGDGDVIARYGRMIEWIDRIGHRRDPSGPSQCEEYSRDADFGAPAELRLMLPIV